jgi:hypothetical protein
MHLGILYHKGVIVNHRSLFKVILNPILRYYGWYIGSIFKDDKFITYKLGKCKRSKSIKYTLDHNDCDLIIKKRMII